MLMILSMWLLRILTKICSEQDITRCTNILVRDFVWTNCVMETLFLNNLKHIVEFPYWHCFLLIGLSNMEILIYHHPKATCLRSVMGGPTVGYVFNTGDFYRPLPLTANFFISFNRDHDCSPTLITCLLL